MPNNGSVTLRAGDRAPRRDPLPLGQRFITSSEHARCRQAGYVATSSASRDSCALARATATDEEGEAARRATRVSRCASSGAVASRAFPEVRARSPFLTTGRRFVLGTTTRRTTSVPMGRAYSGARDDFSVASQKVPLHLPRCKSSIASCHRCLARLPYGDGPTAPRSRSASSSSS